MEKDDELKCTGNSYDFGARIYDPRVGRFASVDPFYKMFPIESDFTFAGNNPVQFIDKNGEFRYDENKAEQYQKDYPLITKYLQSQVYLDVKNSKKIIDGFKAVNPNLTDEKVLEFFKWEGNDSKTKLSPVIVFTDKPGVSPWETEIASGAYDHYAGREIQLNSKYAEYVEGFLISDASEEEKLIVFTRFYLTVIHETGHAFGSVGPKKTINGEQYWDKHVPGKYTLEDGYKVQENIWGYKNYQPYKDKVNGVQPSGDYVLKPIDGATYRVGTVEGIIENAKTTKEGKTTLPTVPKADN